MEAATSRAEVDEILERSGDEDEAIERASRAETRQLEELRRRVAAPERVIGPNGRTIGDAVAEAVGKFVAEYVPKRFAKEIEARALMSDQGIWTVERTYAPGNVVTHRGSSWVSKAESRGLKPGDGNGAWRMMNKSGGGS